jgi:hypothetical protein
MEPIIVNPGVFATCAVVTALLAFAGTVGRRYHAELQRELAAEAATATVAPARAVPPATAAATAATAATGAAAAAAGSDRPILTLIRGGGDDRPRDWGDRAATGASALPRAA